MLFSATLDAAVDGLVRRYLTDPARHSVDSAHTPVAEMSHHVLHVRDDDRLPILAELAAAPGRTLVFTRTKSRARALTKRLVALGVPAVELHGNLAQTARSRNLLAFSDGSVQTLVATDIAARGIHVDDVALVVHADPPMEHKAYLHRSGRTARAGNQGTVITLMTDAQAGDVRALVHRAGIRPRTTRLSPGHPLLAELAPGERTYAPPPAVPDKPPVARVPKPRRVSGSPGRTHGRSERSRAATPAPDAGARSHGRTERARDAGARSQGRTERVRDAGARSQGRTERPRAAAPVPDAAAFSARARVGGRRGSR
jgi:superfamily II DNA/RNA helicase